MSAITQQTHKSNDNIQGSVLTSLNDIVRFTQDAQKDDYLLNGFPTDKMNPYRPKNTIQCLVL